MTLTEREAKVLALAKEDPKSEVLYEELYKFIYDFLSYKKAGNSSRDREEIAYDLTRDIYMRMYEGEQFVYLMAFIERIHRRYVYDMYRYYKTLHISPSEYEDALLLTGNRHEGFSWEAIYSVFLENIDNTIDEVMTESCPYDLNSIEAERLRISLILSALRGYPCLFRLTQEYIVHVRMLYTSFSNKVSDIIIGRDLTK